MLSDLMSTAIDPRGIPLPEMSDHDTTGQTGGDTSSHIRYARLRRMESPETGRRRRAWPGSWRQRWRHVTSWSIKFRRAESMTSVNCRLKQRTVYCMRICRAEMFIGLSHRMSQRAKIFRDRTHDSPSGKEGNCENRCWQLPKEMPKVCFVLRSIIILPMFSHASTLYSDVQRCRTPEHFQNIATNSKK